MIYARLYAGMGNQMFQYAFCRYLQEVYQQDICFDISTGTSFSGKEEVKRGNFILDSFSIQMQGIDYYFEEEVFRKKAGYKMRLAIFLDLFPRAIRKVTKSDRIFRIMEHSIQKIANRFGLYTAFDCYCKPYLGKNDNIYVSGLFTCKKYFETIEEMINLEFSPKCNVDEANAEFLEMIKKNNSVCVHIRKGDYVSNKSLDVCSVEYYQKAIDELKKQVKQPVFFIFSNDLQWCKENLNSRQSQYYYVDANDSAHPVEELRLMMNCKHFVLSNSTMSWWAQYLCQNEQKIVISPSVWSKGKISLLADLMEEEWIKMEV